jgi:hypothetical protein
MENPALTKANHSLAGLAFSTVHTPRPWLALQGGEEVSACISRLMGPLGVSTGGNSFKY